MIDAPTLLRIVDEGLVLDPTHQLVAPSSIRAEAQQLLLDDVRRGARTDKQAVATHERITELKIRALGDRASRGTAWRLAREHDWDSLHDAQYLAVATLQADALITLDPTLTARAEGIVPIAPLEDLRAAP